MYYFLIFNFNKKDYQDEVTIGFPFIMRTFYEDNFIYLNLSPSNNCENFKQ